MENNFKISISDSKTYVIIDFLGMVSPEHIPLFTNDADRVALDYGVFTYLLDLRGARNIAAKKVNFNSSQVLPEGLIEMSKKKFAVLKDPIDSSHDLVVLMMQKQGTNIRLFSDLDEAVKFLES